MKTLALHAPLLLGLYLIVMYVKYGMTKDISSTAKHHTHAWEKAAFSVALWLGISIPFMALGFEASEGSPWQFLWLFAGGGIGFVGAAQVFWRGGIEERVHVAGALGGICAGMLAILLTQFSWLNLFLVLAFVVFALVQYLPQTFAARYKWLKVIRVKNSTYWIEVAAIVVVELVFLL